VPSAIAISGTPGTGKTEVAQKLAIHLDYDFIELNHLIHKEELIAGIDSKRATVIADIPALMKHLRTLISDAKTNFVIAGHFVDEIPDELLKAIIILRCHPIQLTKRLLRRGWSSEKIVENLQAEILGDCTAQAIKRHPIEKIFEVDTSQRLSDEIVSVICNILTNNNEEFQVGKISWLSTLDDKLLHQIMEERKLP
jgi:adenylate kinase